MTQQIISAKEAIDLTNKEIQNDDSDLIPIMEKIKEAIKKKDFHCYYNRDIKEYTKDKLKTLGYSVEHCKGGGVQREPDYYKISWGFKYND